jgi:hypothetical protein
VVLLAAAAAGAEDHLADVRGRFRATDTPIAMEYQLALGRIRASMVSVKVANGVSKQAGRCDRQHVARASRP